MARVVWLTDIHLNFLDDADIDALLAQVTAAEPDAVLIGGDIAEGPTLVSYLRRIEAAMAVPTYFVLGNHDFYFSSLRQVSEQVREFCAAAQHLRWLVDVPVAELAPAVGLVGHDGWADARLGDYERSIVMMNDYRLIAELAGYSKLQRWQVLQQLGDQAAEHFRRWLPTALDRYPHVVALTHVPPFRDACWHQGQISDDHWLPHFTCHAVGEALLDVMSQHPDRQLTVLCGHTHGSGETWPLPNLRVITGPAEYGHISLAGIFEWQ